MPGKCVHAEKCRTCRSWVAKAKANGRSCRNLYWTLQKVIENQEYAIDVPCGIDIHEARRIIGRLQGMVSDPSPIMGHCIVCYEDYTTTANKPVAFSCGHMVCLSCVAMDLKKCPKCSKDISKIIPLFV